MVNVENVPKVDLVGVGLNATDTVISLSAFPAIGAKIEFDDLHVLPGGQTATAVVACQTWGMRTRYVGKLGDDHAAQMHHEAFAAAGVEARILTAANTTSAQSIILVDGSGERTVLLKRDERTSLATADLRREWIQSARALHVDGFDTAAATCAAGWAREAGVAVVADLDEIYAGVHDLLPLIDYLIVSRDFPRRLTGERSLEKALQSMQREYGSRLTAATLGHDGVLAWDGTRFHYRSAYLVPVVDTTGAGDLFHAGFIYGLLQNWPLDRQLDFACAAAALNCTAAGARGGIRQVEHIEALMQDGDRYPAAYPAPKHTVFA